MIKIINIGKDTTLMQRPCVTLEWKGKTVESITEIQLRENTVSSPSLMFQVGGGLGSNDLHFYHNSDLYEVYKNLKGELSPHGIKFKTVLTD